MQISFNQTIMRMGAAVFAAVLLASPSTEARQLTVSEALAALRNANSTAMRKIKSSPSDYQLSFTDTRDGLNTLYVLNRRDDSGYIVVSADDVATPLLGYADNGAFAKEEMSPSMLAWLEEYGRQIAYAAEHGMKVVAHDAGYADVAPLLTSMWDQDSPYNNNCPLLNGRRTYTGCVATALAQVINYHKYPEQGEGKAVDYWNGKNLTFDFTSSANKFDYSLMADTYSGGESSAQKSEVAKLMYACGVASEMNYGTDASGANSFTATQGLVKYFKYDKGLQYLLRDMFNLDVWTSMLYKEVSEKRPVYYDGTNEQVGHAFVLDGYSNGYFHVNWGWSGMSNGYFLVTALDPDSQGIGGSTAGYNYNQGAIIGAKPAEAGSDYYPTMIVTCDFGPVGTYKESGMANFLRTTSGTGWFSYCLVDMEIRFGVKVTAQDGTEHYFWSEYTDKLSPNYGINQLYMQMSLFKGLADGDYTVTPAVLYKNKPYDVPVAIYKTKAAKMVKSGSSYTFTAVTDNYYLSAVDLKQLSSLYKGRIAKFEATITNSGDEYLGEVYPVLRRQGTNANSAKFGNVRVDVVDGGKQTVEWTVTVPSSIMAGDYLLYILDRDNNVISEGLSVKVAAAPTATPVVKVSDVTFPLATGGNGSRNNPYIVSAQGFEMDATFKCTAGYYTNQVVAFVFADGGSSSIDYIEVPQLTLDAGQTERVKVKGSLTAVEMGKLYYIGLYDYDTKKWFDNTVFYFKVGSMTGVEEVTGESDVRVYPNPVEGSFNVSCGDKVKGVEVYSMTGALVLSERFSGSESIESVDASSLPTGMYFVRIDTAGGTVVRQIIKK